MFHRVAPILTLKLRSSLRYFPRALIEPEAQEVVVPAVQWGVSATA